MTLGSAAAAGVRLIVWCWDCRQQPDPAEHAARYGLQTTVLDWKARLVCTGCGSCKVGSGRAITARSTWWSAGQNGGSVSVSASPFYDVKYLVKLSSYQCQIKDNVFINQFRLVSTESVDNPVENMNGQRSCGG
jgi:hypothetical protein